MIISLHLPVIQLEWFYNVKRSAWNSCIHTQITSKIWVICWPKNQQTKRGKNIISLAEVLETNTPRYSKLITVISELHGLASYEWQHNTRSEAHAFVKGTEDAQTAKFFNWNLLKPGQNTSTVLSWQEFDWVILGFTALIWTSTIHSFKIQQNQTTVQLTWETHCKNVKLKTQIPATANIQRSTN